MTTPSLAHKALTWLDERTGYRSLMSAALDEPIPGGSRWVYVFGSALLTTLILQFVTGVLLTFYYVPSIDHAHTTVSYIQKEVPLGDIVRGIHYYGASAVIVILLLHLAQVFIWGAYKDRREALWLAGVILLNLLLGFGFTGYLLPWDQKAYFGTQVAGGIASSIPLIGAQISQILLGGNGVGQATLSRFFTLHVFLLPVMTILFIVVHLYLFRHAGPAGPLTDNPARRGVERFYPMQLFKDTIATILVVVVLAVLAYAQPALLGPKANPAAGFVPRPEWYFLWTFQLLKFMPAFVGGVVVPGIVMTALALAPFIDRSKTRAIRARLLPIGAFVVVLAAMGILTTMGLVEDHRDPKIQQQDEAARAFMAEPFKADEIGIERAAAEKPAPAPESYVKSCAGCHGEAAEGVVGPGLKNLSAKPNRSVEHVTKLIHDPTAYGLKPSMPAFPDMPESERKAIAEWLATLK